MCDIIYKEITGEINKLKPRYKKQVAKEDLWNRF